MLRAQPSCLETWSGKGRALLCEKIGIRVSMNTPNLTDCEIVSKNNFYIISIFLLRSRLAECREFRVHCIPFDTRRSLYLSIQSIQLV